MTPQEFRHWRTVQMTITLDEAARRLGLSRSAVQAYEAGRRKGDPDSVVKIPRTVALACAALAHGIVDYSPDVSPPAEPAAQPLTRGQREAIRRGRERVAAAQRSRAAARRRRAAGAPAP